MMSFVILLFNLAGTFLLLLLGGFPKAPTVGFLILNFGAFLLFVYAPDPRPVWRIFLFCLVVPLEVATVFIVAHGCRVLGAKCLF